MTNREPTNGEYVDAIVNPDMTPDERSVVDAIKADLNAQLMEIFGKVKSEVAAEQSRPVEVRGESE